MDSSAILTAMEPVFLVNRVSGLFPFNDKFQLSPFWSLFPPSLFCLVAANAYFFGQYVNSFSGFAGTMYTGLCWTQTLATMLLVVVSFQMGPLYKKVLVKIADIEMFILQLGVQFSYNSGVILGDICVRALALAFVSVINFRTYGNDALQLYVRAVGFYLTQWCINCAEMHIVALTTYFSKLFKSIPTTPKHSDLEHYLQASSALIEVSEEVHELLTKHALITTSALFFCSTLDMYFMIIVIQDEPTDPPLHVFIIIRTMTRAYQLWRLVSSVGYLTDQTGKLDAKLYTMVLDDQTNELSKKEKVYIYFAMKQKITFSACGFFSIDFTLVHSIVAATTNYLVILMQFGTTKPTTGQ